MKTKVLIIEDDVYKSFTTKQVLESQLKLQVQVAEVQTGRELAATASTLNPDMIMFRPTGGIAELLERMKKRKTNRRNTEILLIVAADFGDEWARKITELVATVPSKRVAHAA